MKRTARIALASVGLAWANLVLGDPTCTYGEEEVTSSKVSKDSVTLLGVEPAEGAELRKDTILSVDVQFQIADFKPGAYIIVAMFPTVGFGSMSPDDPGNQPMLQHASGKVHLCISLQDVYEDPGVLWPLSMRAAMLKMNDAQSSSMSVSSRKVSFKSP